MPISEQPKITAKEFPYLLALLEAWQGLKSLGWIEPRFFKWPNEGVEFELIELGSTGIHTAIKRGLDPEKCCWVDYQYPSQPFLVRHKKAVTPSAPPREKEE
jgi:hypothetical protein